MELSDNMGEKIDQAGVLTVIVKKIVHNLKYWAKDYKVVSKSLSLFKDISSGYTSCGLLVKIDASREILQNHSGEGFQSFLQLPKNFKLRSNFYETVSTIVMESCSRHRHFCSLDGLFSQIIILIISMILWVLSRLCFEIYIGSAQCMK